MPLLNDQTRLLTTAILCLATLSSSCSFGLSGPGPTAPTKQPVCHSSLFLPIFDAAVAAVGAAVIVRGAAIDLECEGCADAGELQVGFFATGFLLSGLWGTASVLGFSKTYDCRQAKKKYEAREQARKGP